MRYFKKLVGERIYLSPRNHEDVEKFTEWLNDFRVTDYTGRSGELATLYGEKQYLEKNNSPEATFVFVIVTKDDDKMIGSVSLDKIDWKDRNATLGIMIGEEEYRSKGYGTEAIRLILEYGFKYMNLHNIQLDLIEFNARALRCYQKCGFKEYGRRRKCEFLNGQYYDKISMDILAEEFTGDFIQNKEH